MKNKGFTLIELLLVIAIVALLSSIVLASTSNARKKAADAKIRQEVYEVQKAIALFYDENGRYPIVDKNSTMKLYCLTKKPCYLPGSTTLTPSYLAVAPSNSDFAFIKRGIFETAFAKKVSDFIGLEELSVQEIDGRDRGIIYSCADTTCSSSALMYSTNYNINSDDIYKVPTSNSKIKLYVEDSSTPNSKPSEKWMLTVGSNSSLQQATPGYTYGESKEYENPITNILFGN